MGLAPLKLVLAKLNVIHVVITHGIILSLCLSGDPSNGLCDYRIIFLRGYQEQPVKPWDVQPSFARPKDANRIFFLPVLISSIAASLSAFPFLLVMPPSIMAEVPLSSSGSRSLIFLSCSSLLAGSDRNDPSGLPDP